MYLPSSTCIYLPSVYQVFTYLPTCLLKHLYYFLSAYLLCMIYYQLPPQIFNLNLKPYNHTTWNHGDEKWPYLKHVDPWEIWGTTTLRNIWQSKWDKWKKHIPKIYRNGGKIEVNILNFFFHVVFCHMVSPFTKCPFMCLGFSKHKCWIHKIAQISNRNF